MLGGTWAFRVENDRIFSRFILAQIFNRSLITNYSLSRDQEFLGERFWPYAYNKTMGHDSYLCNTTAWSLNVRAFPTQRPTLSMTNYCFVGCQKPCCPNRYIENTSCPIVCRPKEHQDWIYC
jgi:hypothetical protein